jgi:type VI secretion system secreted protein Hcp
MVLGKVRALRSTTVWLVVLLLAATVLLVWRGQIPAPPASLSQANAAVAHPTSFNVQITGTKQGAFKGEGLRLRDRNRLVGITYAYELSSPRDAASGQPSGKRQHHPVTFTKEWGAATPQILAAAATNEVLKTVVFEFFKTDSSGKEYVFQSVKLTNATISDVKQYTDKSGLFEIDEVSFTFQKIEVTNNDGKTTFVDDWQTVT